MNEREEWLELLKPWVSLTPSGMDPWIFLEHVGLCENELPSALGVFLDGKMELLFQVPKRSDPDKLVEDMITGPVVGVLRKLLVGDRFHPHVVDTLARRIVRYGIPRHPILLRWIQDNTWFVTEDTPPKKTWGIQVLTPDQQRQMRRILQLGGFIHFQHGMGAIVRIKSDGSLSELQGLWGRHWNPIADHRWEESRRRGWIFEIHPEES